MVSDLPGDPQNPDVYTIGYGSRTIEALVETIEQNGIDFLVDVRSSPYSRYKPEFNREALEAVLGGRGIRYVFLGDALGGRPDDPDCYADGKVDYDRVRNKEFYLKGIDRLLRAREQGTRMALICSEGRPEECHRSKLIGATLTEREIPVTHLDEDGIPRTQAEVIDRLTGGQLGLFGDPSFTSRKRYEAEE